MILPILCHKKFCFVIQLYKYRRRLGFVLKDFFQIHLVSSYSRKHQKLLPVKKNLLLSVKRNCQSWYDSACIFGVKKIIFLKRDATDFLSIRILERVLWAREKVWCWIDKRKLQIRCFCKDTKVTSETICEALQRLDCCEVDEFDLLTVLENEAL